MNSYSHTDMDSQTDMSVGGGTEGVWSSVNPGAVGGGEGGGESGWEEGEDGVPEDPLLAESHYSQFEDFESLSSDDEVSGPTLGQSLELCS